MTDSARISPTAHYTGYVWCRHRLSPPELATTTGRVMFESLRGPMHLASKAIGGLTLEKMLLQRHHIIDHLVSDAVARGEIAQVVEVAAGMSGRGLRLTQRHPGLRYVEADLPAMAARKREVIANLRTSSGHRVVDVDALATTGPLALTNATRDHLDLSRPTAVITEGLLNYFSREHVEQFWRSFATLLEAGGMYVTDLHMRDQPHRILLIRTFTMLLGTFARGSLHLHYERPEEAAAALEASGFTGGVRFVRPSDVERDVPIPVVPGHEYVTIVCARKNPS